MLRIFACILNFRYSYNIIIRVVIFTLQWTKLSILTQSITQTLIIVPLIIMNKL